MKKFDALIANYLYTNRKVSIEGIGVFELDEQFVLPPDTDKAAFFPLTGIQFQYDGKAATSPELLEYIVAQTGKIKSLVQADFSSYASEVKQFVNIGKPWTIEGVGTLHKTKEGVFELIPGEVAAERVNVHYDDPTEDDEPPVRRRKWLVGFILTIAIVAVVAGVGFGVYVLFIKVQDNRVAPEPVTNIFPEEDTIQVISTDTVSTTADSAVVRPDAAAGQHNYRAYFEITRYRSRAVTRTTQLAQYGVDAIFDSVRLGDSLRYRLFVYQNITPADTTRKKDSLSLYFGRRVWLERIR